jgi:hypothetical protein
MPIAKQRHRFADDIHVVQNVVPSEADSVTSAWDLVWLASFGSRQA